MIYLPPLFSALTVFLVVPPVVILGVRVAAFFAGVDPYDSMALVTMLAVVVGTFLAAIAFDAALEANE